MLINSLPLLDRIAERDDRERRATHRLLEVTYTLIDGPVKGLTISEYFQRLPSEGPEEDELAAFEQITGEEMLDVYS